MTEVENLKEGGLKESNGPWTEFVFCAGVSTDGELMRRPKRAMSGVDIEGRLHALICAYPCSRKTGVQVTRVRREIRASGADVEVHAGVA